MSDIISDDVSSERESVSGLLSKRSVSGSEGCGLVEGSVPDWFLLVVSVFDCLLAVVLEDRREEDWSFEMSVF